MKWTDSADTLCPIARASAIIGDRWTILILREAFLGARTFDNLRSRIGLSPHLLSVRLKRLVEEEIFQRGNGMRGEYRLTASGRALLPTILSLAKWGNEWRNEKTIHTEHIHKGCGHTFEPTIVCLACGDPVGLDVETRLSAPLMSERAQRQEHYSRRKSDQ